MNKKTFNYFLMACVSSGFLTLSGCSNDELPVQDSEFTTDTSVAEQPSVFDFATSRTVKLVTNFKVTGGTISTFDLYSENPLNSDGSLRQDLSPVAGGIHVAGSSQLQRTLPSYVEELYMYCPNLFVPLLSYAKIQDNVASFSQLSVGSSPETKALSVRTTDPAFWNRPIAKYLKTIDDYYTETADGHYKYDLKQPDMVKDIPGEVLTAIGLAFPEYKAADENFRQDATISLVKNAEVFVSAIHCGATMKNSFSYVVYEGPKKLTELTEEEKMELEMINIFQFADVNTNTRRPIDAGLTPGHYIQLLYKNAKGEYVKEFPAGAQIGWILHRVGFNEKDFSVNTNSYLKPYFSAPDWNDVKDSKTGVLERTIYFSVSDNAGNKYNCFGFEDQDATGDDDCNDLIFHVYTNPATAVIPPGSITDEDGDEDIIEKSEELFGLLAYEDTWPRQHDYDMNDVVLKYHSTITYGVKEKSAKASVIKTEDVFTFIHTGAAFKNAFNYKVHMAPEKVKSITIDGAGYTMIPDGDGFIVELCPNVKDVIAAFKFGATPKVYTVVTEFADEAVSQEDFVAVAAPYNPYIVPLNTGRSGVEVHLPMYPPTSNINMKLFGTEADRSNPEAGIWFVSGTDNQYPFAIHLAGVVDEFTIPIEGKRISEFYPQYIPWVESNKQESKDWYLFPKK